MTVSALLAAAYNHVIVQPASKFLYGGVMLQASHSVHWNTLTEVSYRLLRQDHAGETMWIADFSIINARAGYGVLPDGQVDLFSFMGNRQKTHRGVMKLGKIKGDAAQFQRDLIIIRMFIEGENEYDHLKNE